ncbi:MAG: hypothetical protein GEU73_15635 [Chloroflexi bacterium]|nr:hypothetical protein [Chloroflexota bacterium]
MTVGHVSRVVNAAILATAIFLLSLSSAAAADIRSGQAVTVSAGETIRDDVYAAGNTVTIDGTIDGDLFAAGNQVLVNGRVTGSLFAAGANVVLSGPVDGSVRASGGSVTISDAVTGDLVAAGGMISVDRSGRIGRDILVTGGSITLSGPTTRNVKAGAGQMLVDAPVGGNIDAQINELTLGPGARVSGEVRYQSATDLRQEPGALVTGDIVRQAPPEARDPGPTSRLMGALFQILAITVVGAAALLLTVRGAIAAGAAVTQRPLLSLGWGFGLLVGIPVAAILLLVTIIGIPLAIIALVSYGIMLYVTQAIVALGIGRLLLGQLRSIEGVGWSLLALVVGALILVALRSIPFLDVITTLLVFIFGLGAMWIAYLEARAPHPQPAPATEA